MLRSAPALLVRTHATASDAVADIRQISHDVESGVSVSRVDDMSDLVAAALADDRLRTVLIVLFASIAGLLAAMIGVGLALAGTRMLAPYLYDVRVTDPAVYATVGLLLVITTIAATWIPARRATRVRLVETLAAE